MKAELPPKRRKFANDWDEIEYLYQKLLYWLYERDEARKAAPYSERLERVLAAADPNHESIFGEECWSLIYETRGDIAKAIEHRENEIRLMRRLHELTRQSAKNSLALEGRGYDDLSDRLDLLATLYYGGGDLHKAIALLRESRELCESAGSRFDGEDLLKGYLKEKRNSNDRSGHQFHASSQRRKNQGQVVGIDYSRHGGRHNVAIVALPAMRRLVHLSVDGERSWAVRDYIRRLRLRRTARETPQRKPLARQIAAIAEQAVPKSDVPFVSIRDRAFWRTFLEERSRERFGDEFDAQSAPSDDWGDWEPF